MQSGLQIIDKTLNASLHGNILTWSSRQGKPYWFREYSEDMKAWRREWYDINLPHLMK